jgi:NADH:ubiquinone oxidoreductase subunit 6 (subunit J)
MNIQINQFLFFILYSFGALTSILFIIFLDNIIYCLLFLILFFINISGILFLLEVEYLAIMVILIYVSAVSIFFLFIIMTIDLSYIKKKGSKKEDKEEKKWLFLGLSSLSLFIFNWDKVFKIIFGSFNFGMNEFYFGDRLMEKEKVHVLVSFPKPCDIERIQILPYKQCLIPTDMFGNDIFKNGFLNMGVEHFDLIVIVDSFFDYWSDLFTIFYIEAGNESPAPKFLRRLFWSLEDIYSEQLEIINSKEMLEEFKKYIVLNKKSLLENSQYHAFMDRELVEYFVYPKELAWGKNLVYNFCKPLKDNVLPLQNFFITTEKYSFNKSYDSLMDMHNIDDVYYPFYNECYLYLIFLGLILLLSLIGIVLLTTQSKKKRKEKYYNFFYCFS